MPPRLTLTLLRDTFAVCRLAPDAPIPQWALGDSPFVTISRTNEELSVTTLQALVPSGVQCERDYRILRVQGPLPLDLIGIFASIATPIADAGLGVFPIATYDTDWVLVKASNLRTAIEALRGAGHVVVE